MLSNQIEKCIHVPNVSTSVSGEKNRTTAYLIKPWNISKVVLHLPETINICYNRSIYVYPINIFNHETEQILEISCLHIAFSGEIVKLKYVSMHV